MDDSLIMLSALQHYMFCKRQCALIHVENVWTENYLTASGRVMHQHVDERNSKTRRRLHQATAVRLVSRRLGITGVADMVEFHGTKYERDNEGRRIAVPLPGLTGFWRPFSIEYKRGKPKSHHADEVQLCAQAICLEEMLEVEIPQGALFYGETRHRIDVPFDAELRYLTEKTAKDVHALLESGETPPVTFGKWCAACSLVEECRPKMLRSHDSVQSWLMHEMDEATT